MVGRNPENDLTYAETKMAPSRIHCIGLGLEEPALDDGEGIWGPLFADAWREAILWVRAKRKWGRDDLFGGALSKKAPDLHYNLPPPTGLGTGKD